MPETTLHKPARSRRSQEEKDQKEKDAEMIRISIRWANRQPDEDLLDRFFVQCVLEDWDVAAALNETEERWVLANLGEFLLVAGAKRKTARRDLQLQEEFEGPAHVKGLQLHFDPQTEVAHSDRVLLTRRQL